MKIHPLTVTFCRPEMLAHAYIQFHKFRSKKLDYQRPTVISGHYPVDYQMNIQACWMIADALGARWFDPLEDIGSAQSQNWAMQRLEREEVLKEEDLTFNMDADSQCLIPGWDEAMVDILKADPKIAFVSLNAPIIAERIAKKTLPIEYMEIAGHKCFKTLRPEQFNMTFIRYSILKQINGLPQEHPWYGQVETPFYNKIRELGYYNVYLSDFMENESPKMMHDPLFANWKYMHVTGMFKNKFKEFLSQVAVWQQACAKNEFQGTFQEYLVRVKR